MSPIAQLLARRGITCKRSTGEEMVSCPLHDDTRPSCSVNHDKNVWNCHSCGEAGGVKAMAEKMGDVSDEDVRQIMGTVSSKPQAKAKVKPPSTRLPADGSPFWEYQRADGSPHMRVYRHEGPKGKRYTQWSSDESSPSGFVSTRPSRLILYGLPRLRSTPMRDPVFVVEGEKAADALISVGFAATTWPGGASGKKKSSYRDTCMLMRTDMSPLRGRNLILWPDNDEVGRIAMLVIADRLRGEANIKIVNLPEQLPDKWDAADAVESGWTQEKISDYIFKLLADPPEEREDEAQIWMRWVMLDDGYFVHLDRPHRALRQGVFDADMLPLMENNTTPHKHVARNNLIQRASHCEYLPEEPPGIVESDGETVVNTYMHDRVPVAAQKCPTESSAPIEQLLHVLCDGREEDINFLKCFIAGNIQYPGRKARIAPLIYGNEGYGKSTLTELLRACMGSRNVKTVNNHSLKSSFNAWATGTAINVLEEVSLFGPGSKDAANLLKDHITSDRIQVTMKGRDAVEVKNTTNYLAFTNEDNALPLTRASRRWWVISTPRGPAKEYFKTHLDMKTRQFFDPIYHLLANKPGELRRFFLDVECEWIYERNEAVRTQALEEMVDARLEGVPGISLVRQIISENLPYANEMVVHSAILFSELANRARGDYKQLPNNPEKNKILAGLGYVKGERTHVHDTWHQDGGRVLGHVWCKDPDWTTGMVLDEILRRTKATSYSERREAKEDDYSDEVPF